MIIFSQIWQLVSNHVNNGIKAKVAIQILTVKGKKKDLNWEKYVSHNIKYDIILENIKEYGDQE